MAKWMKDANNHVYEIVDEQLFWVSHPGLYLRPLSDEECKAYAINGRLF